MAEPYAVHSFDPRRISTFYQPSEDMENPGSGWFVSHLNPVGEGALTSQLEEFFREVPSAGVLGLRDSPSDTMVIPNAVAADIGIPQFDEWIDQTHPSESRSFELRFAMLLHSFLQKTQSSASRQKFWTYHTPSLSDDTIHTLFQNLVNEAHEPSETVPPLEVIQETKRIVTGLRSQLPKETDIYPEGDGKVAVEIFGEPGHAFLLMCEPGGSALCVVTVDGISRRARYEDSTRLPDGFVREGLRDVHQKSHDIFQWPQFDW